MLLPEGQLVQFSDSPFILGLGVPGTGLTVFSCDLEPTAREHKYVCHQDVVIESKA